LIGCSFNFLSNFRQWSIIAIIAEAQLNIITDLLTKQRFQRS